MAFKTCAFLLTLLMAIMLINAHALPSLLEHRQLESSQPKSIAIDFENQAISPTMLYKHGFRRLVAVGNCNGDLETFMSALQDISICDEDGNWIARHTILVVMGNVLSNTLETFAMLTHIIHWTKVAPQLGSACLMITGETEALFMDPRIDSQELSARFQSEFVRFRRFNMFQQYLSNLPFVRIIGDVLFVYGGLSATTAFAFDGDIRTLNARTKRYFKQNSTSDNDDDEILEDLLFGPQYDLHENDESAVCVEVSATLGFLQHAIGHEIKHMVIGRDDHTKVFSLHCPQSATVWFAGCLLNSGQFWQHSWPSSPQGSPV